MADAGGRADTGRLGENAAAAFLEAKGYRVMERNYRFNREEVDLVCFHPYPDYALGGELVFVEVKARRGDGFGPPEAAVDKAKQRAVMRVAEAFLHERRLEGSPVRFDVVAVVLPPAGSAEGAQITHFENAFGYFV